MQARSSESVESFQRSESLSRDSVLSFSPNAVEYKTKMEERGNCLLNWSLLLNVVFVICLAIFTLVLIAKFDEANFHRKKSNLLNDDLEKEKEKVDILSRMEKIHEKERKRCRVQKFEENNLMMSKMAEKDLKIEEMKKESLEMEEFYKREN